MLKRILLSLSLFSTALLACGDGQDQTGTLHPIHIGANGSNDDNIVIVIMGDRYTASQIARGPERNLLSVADTFKHRLIEDTDWPFHHFADRINLYAIEVHSPANGAYFGANDDATGSRCHDRMRALLRHHNLTQARTILHVVHSESSRGFGVSFNFDGRPVGAPVAALGKSPHIWSTMFHEMGHSMAGYWIDTGLADERNNNIPPQEMPNQTRDKNPLTNRWRAWLGVDNISIFEFDPGAALTAGWFSPIANCDRPPARGCGTTAAHFSCRGALDAGGHCERHRKHSVCKFHCEFNLGCKMMGTATNIAAFFCRVCETHIIGVMAGWTGEPFMAYDEKTTSVSITNAHNRILPHAFVGMFKLETLNIASTVRTIGDYAFLRCTSLTTINMTSTNPPTINEKTFYGVNRAKVTVNVPEGTAQFYKAAGWTGFNMFEGGNPVSIASTDSATDNRYGIRFTINPVSEQAEISVVLPSNERAVEMNVVIYDMTGNVVWTDKASRVLTWDLRNPAGRFVANGTYLVIAEVKGADGRTYQYSARLGVKR